jgi:hypothetical protein
LDQFIIRYNKESMLISGAGDQLRISGFCHGVRSSQLVEKLHEDFPKTMEILMEKARAFVRGKGACSVTQETNSRSNRNRPGWSSSHGHHDRGSTWNRQRSHPYPQFDRHTDRRPYSGQAPAYPNLMKTPKEILQTENVRFPTPAKQTNTKFSNSNRYCDYHRDKGHDTDECRILKSEIEKAVKSGKLAHLV